MHSRETPAEVLADGFDERLAVTDYPDAVPSEAAAPEAQAARDADVPPPRNSIGMPFVLVPAGEFVMGLPDAGIGQAPPESPAHQVEITRPFHLGQFEVTQLEYASVMKTNPSWHSEAEDGKGPTAEERAKLPVEQVTWNDAAEFCRRLSDLSAEKAARRTYRLPTEAEWEYACRGGKAGPYMWRGRRAPDDESGENAGVRPSLPIAPVGSYPPNKFGLHDMRGNVWEWCADWFDRDYYLRSPERDPQGPADGYLKVVRGGDWRVRRRKLSDRLSGIAAGGSATGSSASGSSAKPRPRRVGYGTGPIEQNASRTMQEPRGLSRTAKCWAGSSRLTLGALLLSAWILAGCDFLPAAEHPRNRRAVDAERGRGRHDRGGRRRAGTCGL